MQISRLGVLVGSVFVVGACSSTHLSRSGDGDRRNTGGSDVGGGGTGAGGAGSGGVASGGRAGGVGTGGSLAAGGIGGEPVHPGCPAIACVSGVDIRFPIAVSLGEVLRSRVEVCRNGECYEGTWKTTDEPSGDSGIGFSLPDFGDQPERRDQLKSPLIEVTLWKLTTGLPRLDVQWRPWSDADLKDGDLYRVVMTNARGRTLIRFDRRITYADNSIGSATCPLSCAYSQIDVDAAEECPGCSEDAGAHPDGGSEDSGLPKDGS
jgi:hypothetical protein